MYPTISHLIFDLTGWWCPLPLKTFGFFIGLALLFSYFLLDKELKRKTFDRILSGSYNKHGAYRRPQDQASTIIVLALFFGIIGARIFSILEYPRPFLEAPLYVLFSSSGFTYYGGLIVGAVAVLIYAKRIGLNATHLLDAASPALMFGYAIGRLGCHLSGDGDWGVNNISPKPSWLNIMPDWLWSYDYPHNVINEGVVMPDCYDKFCSVLETPVYPTPLYEFIFCSVVFIGLWLLRKRMNVPGLMFSIYLLINGVERFAIEQIRVDAEYEIFGIMIKQAEIISVALITTGLFLIGKTGVVKKYRSYYQNY